MNLDKWVSTFFIVMAVHAIAGCSDEEAASSFRAEQAKSPKLSVSPQLLGQALRCTANLADSDHNPVLMVPGTTLDPDSNFSWNWFRALDAMNWPYCAVELPDNSMSDIQLAAEYVVYAVRYMAAESGSKVHVLGHSQGGMVPRWAIRFWPDIRPLIDDVVGFSASNHGTLIAGPMCLGGCAPAIWQQDANSNFMAALNADFETVPSIDYTSIYTNFDQVVVPNMTLVGASSALVGDEAHVVNVATQEVCPFSLAEHLTIGTTDPVAFALAMDAISHDGPADLTRLGSEVCTELFMPGVNALTVATDFGAAIVALTETLATQERASQEPVLACYVSDTCDASE